MPWVVAIKLQGAVITLEKLMELVKVGQKRQGDSPFIFAKLFIFVVHLFLGV